MLNTRAEVDKIIKEELAKAEANISPEEKAAMKKAIDEWWRNRPRWHYDRR